MDRILKPAIAIFIFLGALTIHAQSYTTSYSISSTDLQIISLSVNYYYRSNSYVPSSSFDRYQSTLSAMEARYDHNFKILSKEYKNLYDLVLINKVNQAWLISMRSQIIAYSDAHSSNADFGREDVFQSWLKYYTQVFKNENVKNELLCLQSISETIRKLKADFPYDFHTHSRYIELGKAIEELRNANPSEIPSISWKYGLI